MPNAPISPQGKSTADWPSLLHHMRFQATWCARMGSPLNAVILERAALDMEHGGPVASLFETWTEDPAAAVPGLRLTGALQALVISGAAPVLVPYYDPPKIPDNLAAFDTALRETVAGHLADIKTFMTRPVQTNEVGRSACLLGGFLYIAKTWGKPLRLLEIGASGGLNLLWDRFHYDLSGLTWGDPASPLHLAIQWRGAAPPIDQRPAIVSRQACDVNPINLHDDGDLLRIRSYIWPGQHERLVRFQAAATLAREEAITVDRSDAVAWLAQHLAEPMDDVCTVIFHSIMWQYMPIETQKAVRQIIDGAGQRATPSAPQAWLRMEPMRPDGVPELRLTCWPDSPASEGNAKGRIQAAGSTLRLAYCHPHGNDIEWGPAPEE